MLSALRRAGARPARVGLVVALFAAVGIAVPSISPFAGQAQAHHGGWHPCYQLHGWVKGAIEQKYRAMGGPNSVLRCPTTGEIQYGDIRYTEFEGGGIYWHPATGAREVHGSIGAHYKANFRRFYHELGWPITNELDTAPQSRGYNRPPLVGKVNHFSRGGSIYWSSETPAREVHGAIWLEWRRLGAEAGVAGYPVTDEHVAPREPDYLRSCFQKAHIKFHKPTARLSFHVGNCRW